MIPYLAAGVALWLILTLTALTVPEWRLHFRLMPRCDMVLFPLVVVFAWPLYLGMIALAALKGSE